ncbi:hypothetical protein [Variovorax sp. PCZ-1]|uniref:hypothetical protein n=1 Tax=Variovorax sp. PCZ-1 TaxID=2835533 RepID=UPI001BCA8710|nr:hypothetical protein [Variovorax sp. PCZ-1]MBS7806323.1 hypothetical protein [Variovorax sp. PCZ-1]
MTVAAACAAVPATATAHAPPNAPPAAMSMVYLQQIGISASSFTSLRYMRYVDGCE